MITANSNHILFKNPYSENYDECVDQAKKEQNDNARRELSTHVEDMAQYNVIYLGYPNWWGTMPMAMFAFIEEYDFSGKTIVPFCTHGWSILGTSEDAIVELVPDAKILEGLAVSGSSVTYGKDSVKQWLDNLKF